MEAGRSLDALIAEKVMGCQLKYLDPMIPGFEPYLSCQCVGEPHNDNDPEYPELFRYSTSIEAAWEVVEKIISSKFNWSGMDGYWDGEQTMTELRPEITMQGRDWSYRKDSEIWEVRLMDMHYNTFAMGNAEKLPLAICRAAIRAVGMR